MAINKKLIHFSKKATFTAELEKSNILDTSLVFIKDTLEIWTHGLFYGLSTEQAAKIEELGNDIDALRYFKTITGNTGSAAAPTSAANLNIKGTKGITTTVDGNGVSIAHTNNITAGTVSGDTSKTLTFGGTFTVPSITYDANGHITGKSSTTMKMPANPNTHYEAKNIVGATATATADVATTNTTTFLNLIENSAVRSSHQITGSGKVTVSADDTGKITINGANATVASGSTNGTIVVDGQSVAVKGLGSAAYTNSSAYATTALGTKADNAVPNTRTINGHVLSADVTVTKSDVGLGNVTNESKATMFTSPKFTGTPTAPTAATNTNSTLIATTAFVQSVVGLKIAAADALRFKGIVDSTHTLPTENVAIGDTYKVNATGVYGGVTCEVGDMIIALDETPTWTVILANIDGAVTSTDSLTSGAVVIGNGAKAVTLASTIGASNKGIYFDNGVPKATSYAVNKEVPSNAVFTDTKVTSVSNHYTPSGGAVASTTAGSAVAWSGKVITGIIKDAAGHITGVTTGTIPANPNTNTTYTFANGSAGNFTVTPSGGSAQTISVGKPSTAGTADIAKKLQTALTITLDGDVSGSTTFDGSAPKTINVSLEWEEL